MKRFAAILSAALLFAHPSFAQQVAFGGIANDPSAPVEVTADQLSVDQNNGSAIFEGNVIIGQGAFRLSAGRVVVIYAAGSQKIDRMEATGGVTLVNGGEAAEADRADYSITNNSITLRGNVLVTQGQNALTSDSMVLNLATGTAQMDGRVKTLLNTGQN
ncbi:lipopolysaccharide transport periplasmic protein LptA [Nereida sp. MMG025]|uniref:lipopolysaccharide transport periplasmic protein LptA n=1 Tax=Nereida sp. MMG025 TaxID=2909981 RepID=UPI001F0270FE|nr:lipopolysaccharide transport periplasmic protein LptA [Nereida sp. MMG025]MCF6444549.1 lipopolysaccharide transport periplasmic protein LptA [Nereida sp. MMG025]